MDNCWISCQVMADMKKVYDDIIIINLYRWNFSTTYPIFFPNLLSTALINPNMKNCSLKEENPEE